jgi:ribosomal protein S18 acetylase RimI-like enzyme
MSRFIYWDVLFSIVRYVEEFSGATRIVLLVQGRNPAAVRFYKRLRFDEIDNSKARPAWSLLLGKLMQKKLLSTKS